MLGDYSEVSTEADASKDNPCPPHDLSLHFLFNTGQTTSDTIQGVQMGL
jgi:hypothetical protein